MRTLIALALTFNVAYLQNVQLTVDPPVGDGIAAGETVAFTCKWEPANSRYADFKFGESGNLNNVFNEDPYKDIISMSNSNARAYVFFDDSNGNAILTIKDVSKADEHLFACSIPNYGTSEPIKLSVIGGDSDEDNNGDNGEMEVTSCNTGSSLKVEHKEDCEPGIKFCTSPVYDKELGMSGQDYGCGTCGDNLGITCQQCENKPGEQPCNKEVSIPDEGAYAHGDVMILNTLLLPLLLALWAL